MTPSTRLPTWLAQLYAFSPHAFTTPGGAQMSYVDEGPRSDEAVLMLHGNPTWSFYYRELIQALSPKLRCIAPDHIGMGLSEKPQNHPYTLETRIRDIEALVARLELKKIHLVVHDWGGAIGFGFAARHPGLIGRLTILNTAAFASRDIPWRIAACKLPVLGPLLVRGLNGFAGPATWMSMHRRALTRKEKRAFLFPYDSWANRVAVSAFVRDIPMSPHHESRATLAAVEEGLKQFCDRPALVVWGGRDFCFDDRFLARWRNLLPNGRIHRIADAGHYVLADANEEAIPLIINFLAARP